MPKAKACKICKSIFEEGNECPKCGSKESTETFKGRLFVNKPESSEIAQKIGIKEKGEFAIKTR